MKYIKIILLYFLFFSFTPVFASDLIEPDKAVIEPDVRPLILDLEALKKKAKPVKSSSEETDKKTVKSTVKSESGKKKLKKASTSKRKKITGKTSKPGKKKNKFTVKKAKTKTVKTQAKSSKIKPESKKTALKSSSKNIPETGKKLKKDILSGTVETAADKKLTVEEKKENLSVSDKSKTAKDIIIINPSDQEASKNRIYSISYSEIVKWGKPDGLTILKDSPPIVDDVAFYTPDYSAEFKIDEYDRRKIYRLYIDFVKYKGDIKPVNSLLKIWGRSTSGKMFLISEINQEKLSESKIFETLIPYELSSPGRFDIIVREYSDKPGKWGIWDIIITDKTIEQIEMIKSDRSVKMKDFEPKIFK